MANTALITGSTGGLGSCFVKIHAEKGGDLILVGMSENKLATQKKEVEEKYKVHAEYIVADLSDPKQVENVYSTCKQNGWQVDVLINNAGFGGQGDFARERTMQQDIIPHSKDSRIPFLREPCYFLLGLF